MSNIIVVLMSDLVNFKFLIGASICSADRVLAEEAWTQEALDVSCDHDKSLNRPDSIFIEQINGARSVVDLGKSIIEFQ